MKTNKVDQDKRVQKNDISQAAIKHFKQYTQELNRALRDIDQNELVNFVNLIHPSQFPERQLVGCSPSPHPRTSEYSVQ